MTIGDRVRNKRLELNMTQEELALKMGYKGRSAVNKMENATELTLKNVKKLCKALGCSEAYIMGWEEKTKFSKDRAILEIQITEDAELMKRLKKYMTLSKEKKDLILNMIDNL